MVGRGRPPQPQPPEDPGSTPQRRLDPYVAFVGAFLRQVVTDASGHNEDTSGWTEGVQREAQAFLLDQNRLAPWVELTGADVDKMQGVLLRAAGLARPS